jgi:putative ABC transport system substrate-binding protein
VDFDTVKVAILVSRNIRPYEEAVEGMSAVFTEFSGGKLKVFYLDKFREKDRPSLSGELEAKAFNLLVAVGPEAADFIWTNKALRNSVKLYSVLLNPEKVLGPKNTFCGIPLNIPVQKQIEMIHRSLPETGRIGFLYDARYNLDFLKEAVACASGLGIEIIPLEVSSKKEIPGVLKKNWGKMDVLWLIPDRTVISESIVKYAIKESLFKGVPVIGYNRFFYDNGATLAFVFDYEELGKQCGEKALRLISGGKCEAEDPFFHVWINTRVVKKLGMRIAESYAFPIEVGP